MRNTRKEQIISASPPVNGRHQARTPCRKGANNGLMQAQETANPRPAAVGRGTEFGLLGDIIDWITDRARRPTRVLALGQETDFYGSQLLIHKLPTTITAATITTATITAVTITDATITVA